MDVTSAVEYIQDLALTITGIRTAPDEPPGSIAQWPALITYERNGSVRLDAMHSGTWGAQHGTIVSELHVPRKDLPRDVRTVMSYRESFLRKLQNDPGLGTTAMIVREVRWLIGPMNWGEMETVGYRFEIEIDLELSPS